MSAPDTKDTQALKVRRVLKRVRDRSLTPISGLSHYVVFGAVAMQLWGTTRATRDIDILIEPTVANARRVLRALSALGFGFASGHLAAEVASKPVTIIGDVPNVDTLTRARNVRLETAQRNATTFEVEGVRIPTASIEDLIDSKRTGRLQDAEVLEAIRDLRSR